MSIHMFGVTFFSPLCSGFDRFINENYKFYRKCGTTETATTFLGQRRARPIARFDALT